MTDKASAPKRVSALVCLADGDVENIWVEHITDDQWKVLTVPFWTYNLSRGDIVEGKPDEDGNGLFIERVVKKSGNRTVRILFQGEQRTNHPAAQSLLDYLREKGLCFELFGRRLISVNLSSEEDYQQLIERLAQIPVDAQMIWEEGDPNPRKNLDRSDVAPAQS